MDKKKRFSRHDSNRVFISKFERFQLARESENPSRPFTFVIYYNNSCSVSIPKRRHLFENDNVRQTSPYDSYSFFFLSFFFNERHIFTRVYIIANYTRARAVCGFSLLQIDRKRTAFRVIKKMCSRSLSSEYSANNNRKLGHLWPPRSDVMRRRPRHT